VSLKFAKLGKPDRTVRRWPGSLRTCDRWAPSESTLMRPFYRLE